jgi:hypothetical protein
MVVVQRGRIMEGRSLAALIDHCHAQGGGADLQLGVDRWSPMQHGVGHQLTDEELRPIDEVIRQIGQGLS